MKKTSEILINLRLERGLSKTFVAKIAETSINSYSSWEDGSTPKVGSGILLADYYGVTLDYLYGREERHIESQEEGITEDEKRLITGFRALGQPQQGAVLNVVFDMVLGLKSKPSND